MLSKFVKTAAGIGSNLPIGFGANRVVLVRTAEAKAKLPVECKTTAFRHAINLRFQRR